MKKTYITPIAKVYRVGLQDGVMDSLPVQNSVGDDDLVKEQRDEQPTQSMWDLYE